MEVADTKHELPAAFSAERASASAHKVLRRDLESLFQDDPALANSSWAASTARRGTSPDEAPRLARRRRQDAFAAGLRLLSSDPPALALV